MAEQGSDHTRSAAVSTRSALTQQVPSHPRQGSTLISTDLASKVSAAWLDSPVLGNEPFWMYFHRCTASPRQHYENSHYNELFTSAPSHSVVLMKQMCKDYVWASFWFENIFWESRCLQTKQICMPWIVFLGSRSVLPRGQIFGGDTTWCWSWENIFW